MQINSVLVEGQLSPSAQSQSWVHLQIHCNILNLSACLFFGYFFQLVVTYWSPLLINKLNKILNTCSFYICISIMIYLFLKREGLSQIMKALPVMLSSGFIL